MNEQAGCIPSIGGKVAKISNVPPQRVPLTLDSVMLSMARSENGEEANDEVYELFGKYAYKDVENIITKLCNSWVAQLGEELEDLRQSCMAKLFKSIGAYDGRTKFSTWAGTVCRNHILQKYRYKKRRNATLYPLDDPEAIDSVAAPEDHSPLKNDIANVTRKLLVKYPSKKKILLGMLGNPDDPSYHIPTDIVISEVARDVGVEYQEAYHFYKQRVRPFFQKQFA